jgi:hypothetical protein
MGQDDDDAVVGQIVDQAEQGYHPPPVPCVAVRPFPGVLDTFTIRRSLGCRHQRRASRDRESSLVEHACESWRSPVDALHSAFENAMRDVYTRACDEAGYNATYFVRMLSEHGGLATAQRLLGAPTASEGSLRSGSGSGST